MPDWLFRLLVYLPMLVLAVTVHEASHAWAADRLGDPTARKLGRVSLLPTSHVDLWGTLILPGLLLAIQAPYLFGYAKPTPVDPGRLRSPKRDFSLVALAGPGGNVGLALAFSAAGFFCFRWLGIDSPDAKTLVGAAIATNVLLAWLNLLPLPGFDGLKALYVLLPDEWCWHLQRSERMMFLVLIAGAFLGFLNWAMTPASAVGMALCTAAGTGQPTF